MTTVAVAALAAGAAPADGYVLKPYHWGKHEVSYYNGAKRYGPEVKAAVRAWNRSGARFRWVRGTKNGADVTLVVGRLPTGVLGATYALWSPRAGLLRATIVLPPDNLRPRQSPAETRYFATITIVHELGHALGLGHEVRGCATMSPSFPLRRCPAPQAPWRFQCRLLQPDDVAGAISLYGGRMRGLGPAACDRSPRPKPATGLEVSRDAARRPVVSWRDPGGPSRRHVVLRRRDACPRGENDPQATLVGDGRAQQGTHAIVDGAPPGPGRYCYAVVLVDGFEHPSTPATVQFDQAAPPMADFSWKIDPADARRFAFSDASAADAEVNAAIVAWHWEFGDGTSSAERNPSHIYQPGSYTVRLTVTDDEGQTAAVTHEVYVSNSPTH